MKILGDFANSKVFGGIFGGNFSISGAFWGISGISSHPDINGFSKKIFLLAKCAILDPKMIRRILQYWTIKGTRKEGHENYVNDLSNFGPKMIYPLSVSPQ